MSNPNNALGTNAAFGGRTSVNAFNDVLGTFNGPGILSGWGCRPSSGLTVTLGGNGTVRDVAIAEDSAGNRTTINNISKSPISVTMDAAPASNSRIDAIVAYIESSPSSNALTDNPDVVNLLVVDGTAASTPTAPNDSAIRTAITADGAAGTTAYYVVLAYITIASGTTDIDTTMIASGGDVALGNAKVASFNIDFTTLNFGNYSTTEQDTGFTWIDGSKIYKKTISCGTLPNNNTKDTAHNISNLAEVIKLEGWAYSTIDNQHFPLPYVSASGAGNSVCTYVRGTAIRIITGMDRSDFKTSYVTLYYTKSV